MTRKSQKELAILIGLLILLSISIFSQVLRDSPTNVGISKTKSNLRSNGASNETLSMDLLSNKAPEFSGVKRNIFQFGSGAKSAGTQENFIPARTPQPVVIVAPEIPDVHYLGFYYEKETGLKMVSLSNSSRIYVGKTGQVLGGKYQVLEIAADHVILKLLLQEGKVIRVPLGKGPASVVQWSQDQEQ